RFHFSAANDLGIAFAQCLGELDVLLADRIAMLADRVVAPAEPGDDGKDGEQKSREDQLLYRSARLAKADVALQLDGFELRNLELLVGKIELCAHQREIGGRRQ